MSVIYRQMGAGLEGMDGAEEGNHGEQLPLSGDMNPQAKGGIHPVECTH